RVVGLRARAFSPGGLPAGVRWIFFFFKQKTAYEIAVVVTDVTDAIRNVQGSSLRTATPGSAAHGDEDGSLHPDVPAAFAIGAWRRPLCRRRGGEAEQRGRSD